MDLIQLLKIHTALFCDSTNSIKQRIVNRRKLEIFRKRVVEKIIMSRQLWFIFGKCT